jgi:hypothetical protein
MPANSHVAEPFMSILNGFADATSRMARAASAPTVEITEREVHHEPSGERPEGDGWRMVAHDFGYVTWERTRAVRAANPTADAMADLRAWQFERAAR